MADDETERTGVLVIRAWTLPPQHELIARITGCWDLMQPGETQETAYGATAATRVAGNWLAALERGQAP
jgi:hypothetical protein